MHKKDLTTEIYYQYVLHIKEKVNTFDTSEFRGTSISYDENFKSDEFTHFAHILFFKQIFLNFLNKMIRIYKDRKFYNKKKY